MPARRRRPGVGRCRRTFRDGPGAGASLDALVVAVAGQVLGGRPVEVLAELEHIARFRDPVHATGLPGSPWLAGLRGVCLFLAARGPEAFDLLEREQSRASDLDRPFAAAILGIARALLLSLAGRPVSARHLVDDHRSAIGPGDGPLGQLARIVIAEASALTGDPVRAREVLAGIEGPRTSSRAFAPLHGGRAARPRPLRATSARRPKPPRSPPSRPERAGRRASRRSRCTTSFGWDAPGMPWPG